MDTKKNGLLSEMLEQGLPLLEEAVGDLAGLNTLTAIEKQLLTRATHVLTEALDLQAELSTWDEVGANKGEVFTDEQLRNIRTKAKRFSYASPLVVAIVETYQLLVHSGNRTIKAENDDINAVVQNYVQFNNKAVFNTLARFKQERNRLTEARLFFAYASPSVEGGEVKARLIPDNEITQIYCNPDDSTEVWLFKRTYTQVGLDGKDKEVYDIHPNYEFTFNPDLQQIIEGLINSVDTINSYKWDIPVQAVILNDGVPKLYPVLSWVQCYENLLNMVATVYSAISAIALVTRTKAEYVTKVSSAMSQIKEQTNNKGKVGNIANNVVLDGDIKTLNAKSALLAPNDLDVFLYQISMVVQLPPFAFGREEPATGLSDGQNSNELMRLSIEAVQKLYEETEAEHINYRLIQAVETGELTGLGTVEEVPVGEGYYKKRIVWNDGVDGSVHVTYPPVRTVDIVKQIQARISAHTLDGKTPRNEISTPASYYADVMPLIGRKDVKETLDNLPTEWAVAPTPEPAVAERLAITALQDFEQGLKEALALTPSASLGSVLVEKLEAGLTLELGGVVYDHESIYNLIS